MEQDRTAVRVTVNENVEVLFGRWRVCRSVCDEANKDSESRLVMYEALQT